jgi:hypothetical protein
MSQYSGRDWPFPWETQKHFVPKVDIASRLERAALFLGGRENKHSELYTSAADEIYRLRLLCNQNKIDYGEVLPRWDEWNNRLEKKNLLG